MPAAVATDQTCSGLLLSRECTRKQDVAGENVALPNLSLPPQSPPRLPLPLDLKPSDEPPMVLFNAIPDVVNVFRSRSPRVTII